MPADTELPHGGSVKDLRIQIARLASCGEKVFERTLLASAGPMDEPTRELNLMAHGAAFHGWALAALLGWIGQTHGPQAALEAATVVQLIGVDGGHEGYCDDIENELETKHDH